LLDNILWLFAATLYSYGLMAMVALADVQVLSAVIIACGVSLYTSDVH